jgi:transaldolase
MRKRDEDRPAKPARQGFRIARFPFPKHRTRALECALERHARGRPAMKFFLDTAMIAEIREAASYGILDGITTNPTLIAKTGRGFYEVVEEILALVKGPVSLEVVATDSDGMIRQGKELRKLGPQVVVKCPLTKDGLRATKALSDEGHPVNVTLCFSSVQALLAAKAGATYISPFVGRLDDRGHEGMDVVREIRAIYENFAYKTQILVASVRHPLHVRDAATMGAHVATIPFKVFEDLVKHPLTDLGLDAFLKDWAKLPPGADPFKTTPPASKALAGR